MATEPNPQLYVLDLPLTREAVLAELAAMPGRLRVAVAHGNDEAFTRTRGLGEWSAFQTLCHVRDAALVYSARFRWIVFDDDPALPNYDENNWVAASKDAPADIPEMLEQVAASRADLVRVLTRLPAEGWERTGRHQVMGLVVLEHYVRHQVAHEAIHLEQIRAAMR